MMKPWQRNLFICIFVLLLLAITIIKTLQLEKQLKEWQKVPFATGVALLVILVPSKVSKPNHYKHE